jgi:short-subunit dehydrogenase
MQGYKAQNSIQTIQASLKWLQILPYSLCDYQSTMTSPPVLLLFGCGSNIDASVAEAFKAKGYNLALVSRSISEETSTPTELHIKADLSDTSIVPKIFEKVKEKFGTPPSVVVYNGTLSFMNFF